MQAADPGPRSRSAAAADAAATPTPALDDRELVTRAQRGDRTAFQTLFERYSRRAYSLALGVVKNPDDALDVVQDAFIKAHRYLDKFEGQASFYTWLYRIVMNLAIDHLRKHQRRGRVGRRGRPGSRARVGRLRALAHRRRLYPRPPGPRHGGD